MSFSAHARRRRLSVVLAILGAIALLVPFGAVSAKAPPKIVDIQILSLNDFHGQLEPAPTSSSAGRIGALTSGQCLPGSCVAAGGVEYLATHVRDLRAQNPNTVFVSAGDLIGATPLLSALFHDEPTIEAFNLMGLEFNGVGNHEFDEGVDELLRVAYGNRGARGYSPAREDGCHPVDGCGDEDPYGGATFDFLAANVTYKDTGVPVFAPYEIRSFKGGAKVAFVGMTTKDTPNIVSPGGITSVDFRDEAATVNALVPKLKKKGVEAIVVLLHEGGSTTVPGNGAGGDPAAINSCISPSGVVPGIVDALDDEIDIVITGHTNWAVNCVIDGKIVTGAAAQGRLVTDIDARVDARTDEFIKPIRVNNHIVTQDEKAADLTALIAEYKVFEGPVASVVIGQTTAPITRASTPAGESQLGRLIADAQLADMAGAPGNAVIAFMNPGGIRQDIVEAGDVTHGEAFAVQPFSNVVMTRAFTGAEIEAILEQQFVNLNGTPRQLILQISNGFSYTWDGAAGAVGDRIDPATIKIDGVTIDPTATYHVAMNNFLGFGGDSFPAMLAGDVVAFGSDDLVALENYFAANSPISPPTDIRITREN